MRNRADAWLRDQMRARRNAFNKMICDEDFPDEYMTTEGIPEDDDPIWEEA